MEKVRRLTAEFRGRAPAVQHAGAHYLFEQRGISPAAEHFMVHGPLQRFVMRHDVTFKDLGSSTTCGAVICAERNSSRLDATRCGSDPSM